MGAPPRPVVGGLDDAGDCPASDAARSWPATSACGSRRRPGSHSAADRAGPDRAGGGKVPRRESRRLRGHRFRSGSDSGLHVGEVATFAAVAWWRPGRQRVPGLGLGPRQPVTSSQSPRPAPADPEGAGSICDEAPGLARRLGHGAPQAVHVSSRCPASSRGGSGFQDRPGRSPARWRVPAAATSSAPSCQARSWDSGSSSRGERPLGVGLPSKYWPV